MRLRRVLCFLGWHDWFYFNRARICDCCAKFEKLNRVQQRSPLPADKAPARRVDARTPSARRPI